MNKYSEYNFDEAVREWSKPPIDGVAYRHSSFLNKLGDDKVREFVRKFEQVRYDTSQWRNRHNQWRETLKLDSTTGKHVLDFGCGYGIEALQFARTGNSVSIADISQSNLNAAIRVLNVCGFAPIKMILLRGGNRWAKGWRIDIFYANGVLHHMPRIMAADVLRDASRILVTGGEARLLLYSEYMWNDLCGPSSIHDDPALHPKFEEYVRRRDRVGFYADWYNEDKIRLIAGDYYDLESFDVIAKNKLCTAILRRK